MNKISKIFSAILLAGTMGLSSSAATISELKEQKEETESKMEEAKSILDKLTTEKNNIMDSIKELDDKVAEFNAQIADLEAQKEQLQSDIAVTQEELAAAQVVEQDQYDAMKLRIKYSYENGNVDYLDTVFGSADVSDMLNKSEYVEQIYKYDTNLLNDLIDARKMVADTQVKLEGELSSVETIEQQVNENMAAVETMLDGKKTQCTNYTASMDDYEEQIAQYRADIEATEKEIAAAEAAAAAAAAAATADIGDVPISYTGGKFQWPTATGTTVTSPFGPRWGTYHNGMDIRAAVGTPILAGEAGVVIISRYSSSAGNYVMIDHGGGVSTVYMHNSQLLVSVGDYVTRGQVIALSGNTGWSTGPHCHFGVRINGTYVDPAPYLY